MKSFAVALIAGVTFAQDFDTSMINGNQTGLISPGPDMNMTDMNMTDMNMNMTALRGEELDAHVKERHQRLDMAREMVEMFCQHQPEGGPYTHEVKDHEDGEHRRLDGHEDMATTMTTEGMEAGDEAMDEAAKMERMNKLHKLMDAGEEVAGLENHWLCHQALDIYQELIEAVHEGAAMMHHEENLESGEGVEAIGAIVEAISGLFIEESDAASTLTLSFAAAAIVTVAMF